MRKLGCRIHTTKYKWLQNVVATNNIDTTHFERKSIRAPIKLEDCLVVGKDVNTFKLKHKLLNKGLLKNQCYVCNLFEWQGKPIALHLDHIDGDRKNNVIENLRILCPNCHSQTDTYCGKNIKKWHYCPCGKEIHKNSNACRKCASAARAVTKIIWPSIIDVQALVDQYGFSKSGRLLGVSGNAVKKRIRLHGAAERT